MKFKLEDTSYESILEVRKALQDYKYTVTLDNIYTVEGESKGIISNLQFVIITVL